MGTGRFEGLSQRLCILPAHISTEHLAGQTQDKSHSRSLQSLLWFPWLRKQCLLPWNLPHRYMQGPATCASHLGTCQNAASCAQSRDSDFNMPGILNLLLILMPGGRQSMRFEKLVYSVLLWLLERLAGEFERYLWTVFLWEWQAYFFLAHNRDEFMIFMETRWFSAWWACLSSQAKLNACHFKTTCQRPCQNLNVMQFNPFIRALKLKKIKLDFKYVNILCCISYLIL